MPELPRLKSYSRLEKIISSHKFRRFRQSFASGGPGRADSQLFCRFLFWLSHFTFGVIFVCHANSMTQSSRQRPDQKFKTATEKGVWPWVNSGFRAGSAFWRINGTPKTREPHPRNLMGTKNSFYLLSFWVRGFLVRRSLVRRLRPLRKRPVGDCPTVRHSRQRDPPRMTADHRRRVR